MGQPDSKPDPPVESPPPSPRPADPSPDPHQQLRELADNLAHHNDPRKMREYLNLRRNLR